MIELPARTDSASLHKTLLAQGSVMVDTVPWHGKDHAIMEAKFDSLFPHYAAVFGGEYHDPGIAALYFLPLLLFSNAHAQQWPGSHQIGNHSPFRSEGPHVFLEQHTDASSGLKVTTFYANWDTVHDGEYGTMRTCIRKITGFATTCGSGSDATWDFGDAEDLLERAVRSITEQYHLKSMPVSRINKEGGWFSSDLFSGRYAKALQHAYGTDGTQDVEVFLMPEHDLNAYYHQSSDGSGYSIKPEDLALFVKVYMFDIPDRWGVGN